MQEKIGEYTVVRTETSPYKVFVLKNGQWVKDARRTFFDRSLAVAYFDKICEALEKEIGL